MRKREVRAAVRTLQVLAKALTTGRATLAEPILDWPAQAALPGAAEAYESVKVADVVDAWNRHDVPERRFEARLTPLVELDRIKTVARRASQLAVLAAGMGASAFLSGRLSVGRRTALWARSSPKPARGSQRVCRRSPRRFEIGTLRKAGGLARKDLADRLDALGDQLLYTLVLSGANQDAPQALFGNGVTSCFGKKVLREPDSYARCRRELTTALGVPSRSDGW